MARHQSTSPKRRFGAPAWEFAYPGYDMTTRSRSKKQRADTNKEVYSAVTDIGDQDYRTKRLKTEKHALRNIDTMVDEDTESAWGEKEITDSEVAPNNIGSDVESMDFNSRKHDKNTSTPENKQGDQLP